MYFNDDAITQAVFVLGLYAVVFGTLSSLLDRTPRLQVAPETDVQVASTSVAGTASV
jgi:hypothetical protein